MIDKLGIMQGRLSSPVGGRIQAFPVNCWQEEFRLTAKLGLGCMEWIFEYETKDENPIFKEDGIADIKRLSSIHNVRINSVVADYFMTKRLFGDDKLEVDEAMATLDLLIKACIKAGIPLIEIPLVDAAALRTKDDKVQLVKNLKGAIISAAEMGVKIGLETSLPADEFRDLVMALGGRAKTYVNYDIGNSASLGYDPKKEIALLGEFIANVHIKDRVKGGSTVPLGEGDADFRSVFAELKKANYTGDFIIQAARQDLGGSVRQRDIESTISGYIRFIKPFMEGLL